MSPKPDLKSIIIEQILLDGPLSIADYMRLCLTHPTLGYYTTREPFGVSGDFITAPEVSQMFGELIGIWCLDQWQKLGEPNRIQLVELGPGRGTLINDLLRSAKVRPAFFDAIELHLVEVSPRLQDIQAQTLEASGKRPGFARGFSDIGDGPMLIVGNEFLDALPFQQFIKTPTGWLERVVGTADGELRFQTGTATASISDMAIANNVPEGTIVEISPARTTMIEQIVERLSKSGGSAILIDYGCNRPGTGDTFQALYKQKPAHPLERSGEQDLTNHVDFCSLIETAKKCGCKSRLKTQREFLLEYGLLERAGALGANASPNTQNDIRAAVERLAGPSEMGDLFKVLEIRSDRGAFDQETV
ncbi:MAG: SAM-dependent methyltransferase [Pseudomonadota bacterium]